MATRTPRARTPAATIATATTTGRTSSRVPSRSNTPKPNSVLPGIDLPRIQIEYIDLNDITPYPYNPRDNEKAIPAVAESIKTFGFLVPCVVDDNNVLVAGHTRTEASKLLGLTEVPCIRATGLTPEQINAFRVIDNKVAEQAEWNFDLLAGEIAKLDSLNLDFTQFGWDQQEIDCMTSLVAADCLSAGGLAPATVGEQVAQQARRSPTQARVVIGELVFFLPATAYRNWVDGIRQLCNFEEEAITAELKRRLGMLE